MLSYGKLNFHRASKIKLSVKFKRSELLAANNDIEKFLKALHKKARYETYKFKVCDCTCGTFPLSP